jgi:hypothetical protein
MNMTWIFLGAPLGLFCLLVLWKSHKVAGMISQAYDRGVTLGVRGDSSVAGVRVAAVLGIVLAVVMILIGVFGIERIG